MASLEELRAERLRKLELLRERGINPYPAQTNRTHTIGEILSDFDAHVGGDSVILAGRVMAVREHGALLFCDLNDGTGNVQGYFHEEQLGEVFELFKNTVDIGDFIELSGVPTKTKRGEESILVGEWSMLTKSLRPLPEKWAGLQDAEERFRKRYLDILFNDDVRDMVTKKATFWRSMRNFMENKGFVEVQTPVLESTTGGADAEPFATHHNALDIDVFLRISAGELWQKKLMVAGLPKVFEIGRIFRNEGMSAEHLQDYSQMEFYWAYADYEMGMEFTEELYKHVAKETFGTLEFEIGEYKVNLGDKWERYDYQETIEDKTGIDVLSASVDEIETKLKELKVEYSKENWNKNRAVDQLWKYCRKQLSGPGFLIGVPVFMETLAKRSPENEDIVERFQVILAGSEMGKGYSELNDPVDQKKRFEEQQALRDAGDAEAQMMDESFVEALEYGMPPTCGFGVSERLFAFLSNKPVRETQIFPLMKPKE